MAEWIVGMRWVLEGWVTVEAETNEEARKLAEDEPVDVGAELVDWTIRTVRQARG